MAPWDQDGFELRLDLQPQPCADGDLIRRESGITLVAASPSVEGFDAHIWRASRLPKGSHIRTFIHDRGWNAEVSIPLVAIPPAKNPPAILRSMRLNVAVNNHDFHKQGDLKKGKQLWWRPDWRKPHYVKGGIFLFPVPPLG